MAASEQSRAKAALIQKERRRLELIGIREATRIGRKLQTDILKKFRAGIRDFTSTIAEGVAPLEELLRDGMTTSHLTGITRGVTDAAPAVERGIVLSSVYDKATDFATAKLALTEEQIAAVTAKYGVQAATVTSGLSVTLNEALQGAVAESVAAGETAQLGAARIRAATAGVLGKPNEAFVAQQIFRTNIQMAYGAGRWEMNQDADVQQILWGYEYVAIDDDRVRAEHITLDGITLPKDHQLWDEIWPPNGFNCRCTTIEIFERAETSEVPQTVEFEGKTVTPGADPGFAFNAGKVFSGTFGKIL